MQSGGKIGILLVNLGTPDDTSVPAVRRYLREFLSDSRVIEAPQWLWQIVLNLVILPFRPKKSAEGYRTVWMQDEDESPLRYWTAKQAEKLTGRFAASSNVDVRYAMRYGNPSIASVMTEMQAVGCDRFLIMPLYPQYSAATNATVVDKVAEHLAAIRHQPTVRFLPPYYDDPAYIDALAASVDRDLLTDAHVLMSFHGLPQECADKGDPYPQHCQATATALAAKLGLADADYTMTFQSRFGPKKWLEPYTDPTVEQRVAGGVRNMVAITPGFSADCLETIEEIGIATAEVFDEAGGEQFTRIDCLNADPAHIDMLEVLARRELAGWLIAETNGGGDG